MRPRLALPICLLAAAPCGHGGSVEFNGLLVLDGQTQVSLANTADGASAWVAVGGSFAGYSVSAFDPATDELTLTKAGQTERVRLKTSVLTDQTAPVNRAPGTLVGEIRPRTYIMNLDPALAAAMPPVTEPGPTDPGGTNPAVADTENSKGTQLAAADANSGNLTMDGTQPVDGNPAGLAVVASRRAPTPGVAGGNRTTATPGTTPSSPVQTPASGTTASRGKK